ncbi:lengsin-like [Lytechinus variegatus]|uniref:lengsin-like n=1 Tax=Lytechinus variegatus TaxID=7654 RepID=UPI001BB2117D|nr:lengsin-like [Lytechinus variegatus]
MNCIKTSDQLLEYIQRSNVKTVRFEFSDINGITRCKLISTHNLKDFAVYLDKGVQFPSLWLCEDTEGKIYDCALTQKYRFTDVSGLPSLNTFTLVPWNQGLARITTVINDLHGKAPLLEHPRNIATQQLEHLKDLGYSLLSGYEAEFRIHEVKSGEPLLNQVISGNVLRLLMANDYIKDLMEYLPQVGVDVDTVHSESDVGSLEVTCKPSFGITSADKVVMCKNACKEIALNHGYIASFIPSVNESSEVCSLHFNHSLWDSKTGNVCHDKTTGALTNIAKHWIAGLLAHARALTTLMAPSVNGIKSFGAYQPTSSFEPSFVTWGKHNRSVTFRVKESGSQDSYIENRIPRSDADPYVILAGTVAAGMDGVINKLSLPPESTGDASKESNIPPLTPKLPCDMEDGISALLEDKVLRRALGEDFIDLFVAARRNEIKRYNGPTTSKPEQDKYKGFFDVM